MRKLVIALSVSTLVLAAAAVWLAYQLHAARGELATSGASRGSLASATVASAPIRPAHTEVPASGGISIPRQPPNDSEADAGASVRSSLEANIPRMRAMLEDPDKRAAAIQDFRVNEQRNMPRLGEHLGLREDEYDRLLELLAEQRIRHLEALYQCALNPNCDVMTGGAGRGQANRRELVDVLGAEKAQQFENYRDNLQERVIVTDWRGDLPDSLRLSDTQTEQLVDALGDERRRIVKEWEQRGASENGMRNEYGSLLYSSTAQGVEQRVAEASEAQRRQQERASRVLTAEQLDVFTKRQRDSLDMARGIWEHEDPSENNPSN